MVGINNIPESVLGKIKEYALLLYGVSTIAEFKAAIVDAEFQRIVNAYLSEITKRILRSKADEAKAYEPTEEELIEKFQAKIDALYAE